MADPRTLDGLLAEAAAAWPDRAALIVGDRRHTFAELDAEASALAETIRTLLPGTGQVIAVAAVLDPLFAIAYYGVVRSGNVAAVVNPLLREDGLAHALGSSGAVGALLDPGLLARLGAVRGRLPELRDVLPLDTPRLRAAEPWPPAGPEDVACLHFTSGTTGLPKAVRLSHRNLVVNARQVALAHRLDAASVTVNHLPSYHPMHLNSAVRAGATQVLCPEPDPVASVESADRHGATHLYSLPFRLAALAGDQRLTGLRLKPGTRIASGGSALSPQAAATLTARLGVPVFQGYGLAETSPLTHSDDPDDPVHGSVGRPVAETEHRVVEVTSRAVLPVGGTGEVQVRGPQVMKGYLGGPDGQGLEPDGWFSTGDVGAVGPDGRLVLVDRLKDVFKYHNWLVTPSETERALLGHPLVADCAVFDHPDGPAGSVVHALLVLRGDPADPTATVRTVCAEAARQLPYYQQVRFAQAVAAIPRSANGKVQRRQLRDAFLAEAEPSGLVVIEPVETPR